MRNRKGFTLIELVVAMAVGAILLVMIASFVTSVIRNNQMQDAFVKAQESLRTAGLIIEKDIRESSQSITVNSGDNNCIEVVDMKSQNTIHIYCLENNTLKRDSDILVSQIQDLSINIVDQQKVTINLISSYQGKEIQYGQTLYLRPGQ